MGSESRVGHQKATRTVASWHSQFSQTVEAERLRLFPARLRHMPLSLVCSLELRNRSEDGMKHSFFQCGSGSGS